MKGRVTRAYIPVVLVLIALGVSFSAHAGTQYFYDGLGRISTVVYSNGAVIDYQYDANGNVTLINRDTSSALSIAAVAPTVVHAGSVVTVAGTGFSPDTAQDAVTIGGMPAVVSTASATQLTAIVPTNAPNGPVTVTVGGTTVTSTQSVTVVVPIITGFSPMVVNPGASITSHGTNLDLVPGNTSISVGSMPVTITSLTNTQVIFAAPNTSGYITVSTPYGQGTSSASLIVLPSSISSSNFLSGATLAPDGDVQTVNVTQTSKYGVFQFNATQGQFLSIQCASITTSPIGAGVNYQVISPTGTVVAVGTVSAVNPSIHLPTIPTTGAYLLTLTSSTATFQVTALLEQNASVFVDGSSASLATTSGDQTKRYTFSAIVGDNIGLGISNLVRTNGSSSYPYVQVIVYQPNGSVLSGSSVSCYTSNGGCDINLKNLPTTGVYSVIAQSPVPSSEPSLTMSFTVTISHDAVQAITSTPAILNLNRNGENGRLTFSGTAGTTVAVQLGAISTTPAGRSLSFTVYKPDGTTLTAASATTGYTFNLANLPVTGTYTVYVDPLYGATASVTANVIPSGSAVVSVDGTSGNISTSIAGTYAYFNFSATAGDNIGLGISNLVRTNGSSSYPYVQVIVYQPNGSVLSGSSVSCYTSNGGCDINLKNLPTTGVYSVIAQSPVPSSEPSLTMSFTVTISHDAVQAITSTPAILNLNRNGENGRLTFSGTAGTTVAVQLGAISTTPAGRSLSFTVYKPDGTTLTAASATTGYTFNLANLPVTGTYTVYVDPLYGATASVTANVIPSGSAVVSVDGTSGNISTSIAGTYAYFNFSATAGDNIGLGISNLVRTNGSSSYPYVQVIVYQPNGSVLSGSSVSCYTSNGGCDINLKNLPTTGVYSVIAQSPVPSSEPSLTMSFTVTISHDAVQAITSTPAILNLNRNGENGRLTFSGTAGTTVAVQLGAISTTPAGRSLSFTVYKPDGTTLTAASATTGYTFNLANLPVTGTYTVYVDPLYGATASMTVTKQ